MTAVRRARDLARSALPRSVGERLPAAPPQEVTELLHDKRFQAAVAEQATEQGRPEEEVWSEVKGYLHEMSAAHDERTAQGWVRMGEWFLRAYDVLVDEDDMHALKRLDRSHSLALAFSHRSYLDGMVIPNALAARRFSPTYTFGGANLNLPVIGTVASRTGLIFIRRSTQEIPVYRLALRSYIRQMVTNKRNMAWSIEGGRTRTGKLRPPVHGILKYLTDTVDGEDAPDVQVVPVSVVYDQLHEVSLMTEEARGGSKTPEDWRWLVRFARLQRNRLGRAYLTVGEPFSLRERMADLEADGVVGHAAVERVALDISHRLNRATPVTVTAIVSLSLLGADRALTVDEVLETVEPLAAYIDARKWPVAGAADLRDRSTIRRALAELARSGVLTAYDGGTEPVWKIGDDQHLVAAFYRNTVIHILVERAIGELALLTVSELEPDAELPAGGELQVGLGGGEADARPPQVRVLLPEPGGLRGRPAHRAPAPGRRGRHGDDAGQGARAAGQRAAPPRAPRAAAVPRRLPRPGRPARRPRGQRGRRGRPAQGLAGRRPAVGAAAPRRQRRVDLPRALPHGDGAGAAQGPARRAARASAPHARPSRPSCARRSAGST